MSDELRRAFIALGLEPGSGWQAVKEQHVLLAQGLHPDRFSGEKKVKAEQKLKEINSARDLLKVHFDSDHVDGPGCTCQDGKGQFTANNDHWEGSAAPKEDIEARAARARARDAERQGTLKESAAASGKQEPAPDSVLVQDLQHTVEPAASVNVFRLTPRVRWMIALGCLLWTAGFCLYAQAMKSANNTQGLYDWYNKEYALVSSNADRNWQSYQEDKQRIARSICGQPVQGLEKWRPPFEDFYGMLKSITDKDR